MGEKLYVVGGNIEDSYGFPVPIISVEKYCPDTDQWTLCSSTCNIREAGAAPLGGKVSSTWFCTDFINFNLYSIYIIIIIITAHLYSAFKIILNALYNII